MVTFQTQPRRVIAPTLCSADTHPIIRCFSGYDMAQSSRQAFRLMGRVVMARNMSADRTIIFKISAPYTLICFLLKPCSLYYLV